MANQFILVALSAGFIAFVATPLALYLARRLQFIAYPSSDRWHVDPVPLLGGLGIWLALVLSLLFFGRSGEFFELTAIFIGVTILAVVGVVDDRRPLHPLQKILVQLIAAGVLIVAGIHTRLFEWVILDYLLTAFWVVGIINAINFMDNMDGLAAGVAAAASGAFLLLAVLNGQTLVSSLAAAMLGASLGYLLYNFQPALIFMGDAGSMVLGFMLAVLGIKLNYTHLPTIQTWMLPVLVLALPIFDTTLVVISRIRRGVPIMQGGVDHTSHRLVRLGLSHRRMLLALYALTLGTGLLASVVTFVTPFVANLIAILLGAVGLFTIYMFEMIGALPAGDSPRPGMRVTVMGGGTALQSLLQAGMQLGQRASLVLAPPSQPDHRELAPNHFRQALITLAYDHRAVEQLLALNPDTFDQLTLTERAFTANQGFYLKGRVAVYTAGSDNPSIIMRSLVMQSVENTDLIVIGGDLHENTLSVLAVPEIAAALRHSKRPRVLVCADPQAAFDALQTAGVADIITHAVTTTNQPPGPWRTIDSLNEPHALADALGQIWLERTRVQGALPALIGSAPND